MRNVRSFIKDDNAMAGCASFAGIGISAAICGLGEHCMLNIAMLSCPAISSAIGATIRNMLSVASTWCANILTA